MVVAAAAAAAAVAAPAAGVSGGTDGARSRAPSVLVERIVREPAGQTRITLFDNRVAVVSVRPKTGEPTFREQLLSKESWSVYRTFFAQELPRLRKELSEGVVAPGDDGTLRIAVPGQPELVVRFSTRMVPGLALGRILATLDDLQQRLLSSPRENLDVVRWQPREGDRVALWDGTTAVVTEVRKNGVVVLEHEDSPLIEAMDRSELPVRVRSVLGRRTP